MQKKSQEDQHIENILHIKPENIVSELHSFEGRLAERITRISGSMTFVYLHIIAFTLFFIFKPFQVEILNIFLSLEAIFLATFIMIAQNRQALVDTYREYEEEKEQQEEEREQEELEEEVEDIQKDLDQIKNAISMLQQKLIAQKTTNGSSHKHPESTE